MIQKREREQQLQQQLQQQQRGQQLLPEDRVEKVEETLKRRRSDAKTEKSKKHSVFCILTSKRVFCMPFAGQTNLFGLFGVFTSFLDKIGKNSKRMQ